MATAVVFVDDAIRGDLPPLCVKTGAPATRKIRFHGEVGGRSALWYLLVFFGPVGWIVLLFGSGSERLDVLLPVSEATLATWAERQRDRAIAIAALALAVVLSVLLSNRYGNLGLVPLVLIGGAVLSLIVTHWRLDMAGVDVDLDASRRWVTLGGIHPAFVAAVAAERDADRRSTL
ncbi:MAG: hypothetical protein JWN67_193 [Actinomycetia bacterium]|nr:hypothetical protein [Actinomycetes bacterium]